MSIGLPTLSLVARLALLFSALVMVGVGVAFYRKQQSGGLGGKMSPPKALWLVFAVLYWFFVCPALAFEAALGAPWRVVLGVFSVNIWIRGLVELYMLYVPRNWKPPYGIGHNLFSLALIIVTFSLAPWQGPGVGPWWWVGLAVCAVLTLSMVLETYYAVVFHKLVEGKTTGEEGVWFADASDPRFVRVNRVTAAFNVPLYLFLVALILAAWGLFA